MPNSYNHVLTNEHPVESNWEMRKESHCHPQMVSVQKIKGWLFRPLTVASPSFSRELKNLKPNFLFEQCPQHPASASAAAMRSVQTRAAPVVGTKLHWALRFLSALRPMSWHSWVDAGFTPCLQVWPRLEHPSGDT